MPLAAFRRSRRPRHQQSAKRSALPRSECLRYIAAGGGSLCPQWSGFVVVRSHRCRVLATIALPRPFRPRVATARQPRSMGWRPAARKAKPRTREPHDFPGLLREDVADEIVLDRPGQPPHDAGAAPRVVLPAEERVVGPLVGGVALRLGEASSGFKGSSIMMMMMSGHAHRRKSRSPSCRLQQPPLSSDSQR
jgi:hypothetical protein